MIPIADDNSIPLSGLALVEERNVYGAIKLYPANLLARALCGIAGTETMTRNTLVHAKAIGLTVRTTGAEPKEL